MDLKDVWNVNFDQLTDNEKDDVCHKLVSEDVGTLTASKDLKNALKLFQSLLRLKVEQVVISYQSFECVISLILGFKKESIRLI